MQDPDSSNRAPAQQQQQQQQQQPHLPELPQEVVVSILQALPLRARLRAALVCKAWAATVARVTTRAEVALSSANSQQVQHWLQCRGANLQHLAARPAPHASGRAHLSLPFDRLSQLVSLHLERVWVAAPANSTNRSISSINWSSRRITPFEFRAALEARAASFLPQLQQLELLTCCMAEAFQQLSKLSSLTSLCVRDLLLYTDNSFQCWLPWQDAAFAWPRLLAGLSNLSVLDLACSPGSSAVSAHQALSPISSMQHLRRLRLHDQSNSCDVFSLVPASVTALHVHGWAGPAGAAPQLSNLLQLELRDLRVKASLLHSFPKLQRLVLRSVQLQPLQAGQPAGGAWQSPSSEAVDDALAAVGCMKCLQHLELHESNMPSCQDESRIAALTASSQLTALHIRSHLPPQAMDMQHMPAGTKLPQLTGWTHLYAAAVSRMAECCPALQELELCCQLHDSAAAGSLSQLTSLTYLRITVCVCVMMQRQQRWRS